MKIKELSNVFVVVNRVGETEFTTIRYSRRQSVKALEDAYRRHWKELFGWGYRCVRVDISFTAKNAAK